jgi:hypothetical protein
MRDKAMMHRAGWPALLFAATLLLSSALSRPDAARADGALAVGLPGDVGRQGLAMGWAFNYPTKERAQAEALKRCRGYQDAPQSTKDLCRIVESFRRSCLAVAWDPENGTTGVGWAVDRHQKEAEDLAMDGCMETSDKKRREFCRVSVTRCDGKK